MAQQTTIFGYIRRLVVKRTRFADLQTLHLDARLCNLASRISDVDNDPRRTHEQQEEAEPERVVNVLGQQSLLSLLTDRTMTPAQNRQAIARAAGRSDDEVTIKQCDRVPAARGLASK